jgi:Zn-dependent oligopeptidase
LTRLKQFLIRKKQLNLEQHALLENIYDEFVPHGSNLRVDSKEKYRELKKELSIFELKFNENSFTETNNYELLITDQSNCQAYSKMHLNLLNKQPKKRINKDRFLHCNTPVSCLS